MNARDTEREEQLQAAAERIERGTGNGNGSAAAAAPYRAVYRAIASAARRRSSRHVRTEPA
mgnify:CR=1 FL=1